MKTFRLLNVSFKGISVDINIQIQFKINKRLFTGDYFSIFSINSTDCLDDVPIYI